MLFFLRFRPTIKFQGGSPVDPLFEPPADLPFDSTSQKLFYRHFGVSEKTICAEFLPGIDFVICFVTY